MGKARDEYQCDVCGGRVSLNRADYYECHTCGQQYSTGNEPTLKQARLHNLNGGKPLLVVYCDLELGKGEFQ
jgi:DNA-directed RNA polymerase subunit RPC12/RpoP